jgi:hypothetical protein
MVTIVGMRINGLAAAAADSGLQRGKPCKPAAMNMGRMHDGLLSHSLLAFPLTSTGGLCPSSGSHDATTMRKTARSGSQCIHCPCKHRCSCPSVHFSHAPFAVDLVTNPALRAHTHGSRETGLAAWQGTGGSSRAPPPTPGACGANLRNAGSMDVAGFVGRRLPSLPTNSAANRIPNALSRCRRHAAFGAATHKRQKHEAPAGEDHIDAGERTHHPRYPRCRTWQLQCDQRSDCQCSSPLSNTQPHPSWGRSLQARITSRTPSARNRAAIRIVVKIPARGRKAK